MRILNTNPHPKKEPLLIRGGRLLQIEMCWRARVRAGCLANKLRKPAVEMAAVAVATAEDVLCNEVIAQKARRVSI